MTPLARPQEILLPVTTGLIAVTVLGALMVNLVPLPLGVLAVRPDFCALVLVYWGIHQPRRVGFTVAFLLGLSIDLVNASLFGQHALVYVALLFAAIGLHRRVLNFSLVGQSLHILPLLFAGDLISIAVRLLAGDELPAPAHFAGALIGALMWIPLSVLFRLPRLPKTSPDRV
ncbi:MAG: rod shape-determining protein MreD [Betaproteobacteria bacterium]|nr:MAG: rod shape-determining protein MreD [Betaproteobacteria bacterium]